jgi:NO-binding membrane sensor protein with MHYT domain
VLSAKSYTRFEMHLPWPANPKTPAGWPKRVAIAMLVGLSVFLLSLPVSALLFLNHYQQLYSQDPQNLLSALTSAILVGLALAALSFTALLAIFLLLSLRAKPANPSTP